MAIGRFTSYKSDNQIVAVNLPVYTRGISSPSQLVLKSTIRGVKYTNESALQVNNNNNNRVYSKTKQQLQQQQLQQQREYPDRKQQQQPVTLALFV